LQNCESWSGFDEFTEVCPLTCKQDLEKDRLTESPHGTNHTYPLDKYVRYSQTSGTTGEPSIWMDTEEDWQWMLNNWKEILQKAGVEAGSPCFFAFSFGPFLGFWTAYEAAVQIGCIAIPGGGQSTQARLRAILDNKVEYLFCTPTYALRLLETAKEQQLALDDHSLKKIIVAGECGGSVRGIRHSIDQAWGRESLLFDHYGMTEVGPVAYEIPGGQGGLRILLDSYYAEVIDPNSLSSLADGEIGELVLTPLGRSGSPVLRYRTGDLVRAKRSTDERGNPTVDLLGGILGRTDQMVIVRGVNLYPSAIDAVVRKFPDIAEYEVKISESRGMKEAVIRAECENSVAMALEAALEQTFSLRIAVECLPSQTLPRHEMKANRWKIKNETPR
jgi:phenylacetate-CoA ligase